MKSGWYLGITQDKKGRITQRFVLYDSTKNKYYYGNYREIINETVIEVYSTNSIKEL